MPGLPIKQGCMDYLNPSVKFRVFYSVSSCGGVLKRLGENGREISGGSGGGDKLHGIW